MKLSDSKNFLICLYFGRGSDYLSLCIPKAYLDFCRTLHRLAKLPDKNKLKSEAEKIIYKEISGIARNCKLLDQEVFDRWHRETCEKIIAIYKDGKYRFYPGQAQKWLNMTLKYVFSMGEDRLPGYKDIYPFCHAPLDNIILKALEKRGFEGLNSSWSRLDNYDSYLECQKWIRNNFDQCPLDVEFKLWMEFDTENEDKK